MKLKYSIGQTVWTIIDGKAHTVIITLISISAGADGYTPNVQYTCTAVNEIEKFSRLKRTEDKLFPSRKALIRTL